MIDSQTPAAHLSRRCLFHNRFVQTGGDRLKRKLVSILLSVMMLLGLAFSTGTVSADSADALEVAVQNGETVRFSMDDLTAIWQEEG